jgi:hypothetical protein
MFKGLPLLVIATSVASAWIRFSVPHLLLLPHLAQLDHHCPFTGKCIGKKNMIPFVIFFGSINLLGLLVFGVTAYYVIGVVILGAAKK